MCDKNVKLLNKKIPKVKERRRKIQTDKMAPPEAMDDFYNDLFEENLVLSNFSSDTLSTSIVTASVKPDPTYALLNKLREELKSANAHGKVLEAIVEEVRDEKCSLESLLRVSSTRMWIVDIEC